jgi:hypothetical protein
VNGAGLNDPVAVRVRDEHTVNETSVNMMHKAPLLVR